MAITDTSNLDPKTRVVATTDLPGVPEGTPGTVGRSVGFALTRYRTSFDNGVDLTSVTHRDLVKEDEWDEFVEQRETAAEAATAGREAPSAPAEAPATEEKAAAPADDRLAALLAKSKAAKEKKQAQAG